VRFDEWFVAAGLGDAAAEVIGHEDRRGPPQNSNIRTWALIRETGSCAGHPSAYT